MCLWVSDYKNAEKTIKELNNFDSKDKKLRVYILSRFKTNWPITINEW
jgi:hypothetical protein